MDIGKEQEEYEVVEAPEPTEAPVTLPAPSKPVEAPVEVPAGA